MIETRSTAQAAFSVVSRNETLFSFFPGRETLPTHVELALDEAFRNVEKLHAAMNQLSEDVGNQKDTLLEDDVTECQKVIESLCQERIYYVLTDSSHDKISRDQEISSILASVSNSKELR